MTNPVRNDTDSVEDKSTKRKRKSSVPPIAGRYTTRVVTWAEQQTLGDKFAACGEGAWPAVRILRERSVGTKKTKQYLLEWERHPKTLEEYRPSWIPAASVGSRIRADWDLNKSGQKSKASGGKGALSHGHAVSPAIRGSSNIETLSDSSSDAEAQSPSRSKRSKAPSIRSSADPISVLRNRSRLGSDQPAALGQASNGVAGPEPDTSAQHSISVSISATAIDKADYASVHSNSSDSGAAPNWFASPAPSERNWPKTATYSPEERTASLPPSSSTIQESDIALRDFTPTSTTNPDSPARKEQEKRSPLLQVSLSERHLTPTSPSRPSPSTFVQENKQSSEKASIPERHLTPPPGVGQLNASNSVPKKPKPQETSQPRRGLTPPEGLVSSTIAKSRSPQKAKENSVTASSVPSPNRESRITRSKGKGALDHLNDAPSPTTRREIVKISVLQPSPVLDREVRQQRDDSGEITSHRIRRVLSIAHLIGNDSSPYEEPGAPQIHAPSVKATTPSSWAYHTQSDNRVNSAGPVLAPSGTIKRTGRLIEVLEHNPVSQLSRPPRSTLVQKMSHSPMDSRVPGDSAASLEFSPQQAPGEQTRDLTTSSIAVNQAAGSAGPSATGFDQLSPSNRTDPSMISVTPSPATEIRHENERRAALNGSQVALYDISMGPSALPIQNSIEEEQPLSSGEHSSLDSKATSSQQSLHNERDVAQVDGVALPTVPILGPAEYAISLPAEGKIQSTYSDIIQSKRKTILKFINRHESIGPSNGSPNRTQERNEMVDMIQLLHDTTTHLDLGLPGFSSEYSAESERLTAYANYAGSKFSFLGHLVDVLKPVDCSIAIMARAGPVQDLIEQYLIKKHVTVRRQDRIAASRSPTPSRPNTDFLVELVSTSSAYTVSLRDKPRLILAFDASFDAQDPQVMRMRQYSSVRPPALTPVIHLLVSNSSEHVDLCLPKSMPSPVRLKILVRATYQARPNLGGKPTYVPDVSDEPEGRPMDLSDLQRALRKSPERKLVMLASIVARASLTTDFDANWTLGVMPDLQLTEVDGMLLPISQSSTMPQTPKELVPRYQSPVSRTDTPFGKKRLLDIDAVLPELNKRQRFTPLRDSVEVTAPVNDNPLDKLQETIRKLQAELDEEREVRQKAEHDRNYAQEQLEHWKRDHSDLQRRYEKRMTKCHKLESERKKLDETIEQNKGRQERSAEENSNLKKKVTEVQADLTAVRDGVKAGGGDAAALEVAREESRTLLAKNTQLEKSIANTRRDFEFTRTQYQTASQKAVEFATEMRGLEEQIVVLKKQSSDERRRLKETNFRESTKRHLERITELELERKTREILLRKLEDENRQLKRNRGVQTRGSSAQPPGSPGMDAPGRGTRSRQGSPAPGLFAGPHHAGMSNRGSLLRHER